MAVVLLVSADCVSKVTDNWVFDLSHYLVPAITVVLLVSVDCMSKVIDTLVLE